MIFMKEQNSQNKDIRPRPPVVVVLGHVDHGKTAILDRIRKTNIVEEESGGITQHIGAYEIEHNSKKITFIDTPGHETFSAMRSRGAKVADVAVLVIDATAGVQAQTKEAIKVIKKAGLPFAIALNKMDKKTAQPQKAKSQLAAQEVLTEDMGGKVPLVETSAKTGRGIADLLEMILLLAEMEELKTDYQARAQGTIIESSLDPQQGAIATLILHQGVLKVEDMVATDSCFGRLKALFDFQGQALSKATPSQPVRVLGFNTVPRVGERVRFYNTLDKARKAVSEKKERHYRVLQVPKGKSVLNIIIKADVLGSLEAIEDILEGLPQEKVILRVLKADVGIVNITDVQTAAAAKAEIVAFRIGTNPEAKALVLKKDMQIHRFDVIYELVQGVRKLMEQKLEPRIERQNLGQFKVTVLFKQGLPEQIIGGKITQGNLTKNIAFEVMRNNKIIAEGKIRNIQQEKKDVGKVKEGQEAALLVEVPCKIKEGDVLEAYKEEKKKAVL